MSDTLLHCFACDAFSPQSGDALQCSICSSDFVEIVQVERSPMAGNAASQQNPRSSMNPSSDQAPETPGFPGMLSNLLSSILPTGMMMGSSDQAESSTSETHSSTNRPGDNAEIGEETSANTGAGHEIPPFNDFFSQMFGQFPQGRATASPLGGSNYTRTTHGPFGSSFTFSYGTSSGGGQPIFYSATGHGNQQGQQQQEQQQESPRNPFPFGNVNDGIPQIQNFPDLASFLAQALGAVPGRAGDYASNEAFDNIISELMSRNPQANVQAATDRAIAQIHRFTAQADVKDSKIGEECSICQEDYQVGETLVDLRCHHVYHEECLLSWVKTNGVCPICRAPVQEVAETPEQEALD